MLEIVLTGPPGPLPAGRPVPVGVVVRNVGPGEVWAVGVVDGSEEGVRYPRYRPLITRDGAVVASPGPAEDPLVAPLRPDDFKLLAPGDGFDPCGPGFHRLATFMTYRPDRPGAYRYALELSTDNRDLGAWLGPLAQAASQRDPVEGLIAKVPRGTITAAPYDVEVRR